MNMEEALMEENEDLIDKVGLLEITEIDTRFYVIFFICYALVSFLFWLDSFIG
jgi:hypothetical protein